MPATVFFATNRNVVGNPPTGFGRQFNAAHPHELRYGEFTADLPPPGRRKGADLADALAESIEEQATGKVTLYDEDLLARKPVFGSTRLFANLKPLMDAGEDTLIYIHGFNVSFAAGMAFGLVLQEKLRARGRRLNVAVFSWPSDGSLRKYLSDRDDAAASGLAFSRAFQRLHEFLQSIPRRRMCCARLHLLCHSMGNFVLENTVWHLRKNVGRLPRVFAEIVLAAADVDSDALAAENKLGRLHELGQRVSVYFNREDLALTTSDKVKGNPDRLGQTGPARPLDIPTGTVNVDCTKVVGGTMEHSYYLDEALPDIAETLAGIEEQAIPGRTYVASANSYRMG